MIIFFCLRLHIRMLWRRFSQFHLVCTKYPLKIQYSFSQFKQILEAKQSTISRSYVRKICNYLLSTTLTTRSENMNTSVTIFHGFPVQYIYVFPICNTGPLNIDLSLHIECSRERCTCSASISVSELEMVTDVVYVRRAWRRIPFKTAGWSHYH